MMLDWADDKATGIAWWYVGVDFNATVARVSLLREKVTAALREAAEDARKQSHEDVWVTDNGDDTWVHFKISDGRESAFKLMKPLHSITREVLDKWISERSEMVNAIRARQEPHT